MYLLHEYDDAIMDCFAGDLTTNDPTVGGPAPHAWDEGWAFYAGSLEGETAADKTTSGVMVYKLAGKRCENFGTCNGAAPGTTGVAKANLKHLALARSGRDKILAGDCSGAQEELNGIVNQMTIPLIQGMLKYAYESDPAPTARYCASTGGACDKALAEGWAFAAAVLPRLDFCDPSVAKLVKDNLDVTAIAGAKTQGQSHMKDGYAKLKAEVEKTYPCLGITCEEVGVYQDSDGNAKGGMSICVSQGGMGNAVQPRAPTTPAPATATAAPTTAPTASTTESGAIVAAFAMVLLNAHI
jgi:hypothetical protein